MTKASSVSGAVRMTARGDRTGRAPRRARRATRIVAVQLSDLGRYRRPGAHIDDARERAHRLAHGHRRRRSSAPLRAAGDAGRGAPPRTSAACSCSWASSAPATLLLFFTALRLTDVAIGMFLLFTAPVYVALLAPRLHAPAARPGRLPGAGRRPGRLLTILVPGIARRPRRVGARRRLRGRGGPHLRRLSRSSPRTLTRTTAARRSPSPRWSSTPCSSCHSPSGRSSAAATD